MRIIEADILQIEYDVFKEKMRLRKEINLHRADLARLVCIYQDMAECAYFPGRGI